MQPKEIHQHFGEIQQLMADLLKAYNTLKPASNAAANSDWTTLTGLHKNFQDTFLLTMQPTEDALKTVIEGMRSYLLLTQPYVDNLQKLVKSPIAEPDEVTKQREAVKTWSDSTTSPVSDGNLFLDILINCNGANALVVTQTQNLFNGIIDPSVTDKTIPDLVTSWWNVINDFVQTFNPSPGSVKQSGTSPVGDPKAIVGLIKLHALLEKLYDLLLPNITQTSGDSLDSRILSIY